MLSNTTFYFYPSVFYIKMCILSKAMAPIRQDRRVSKGENGDLFFSSIVAEDANTNYVCVARFPFTNTIQQKPPLILQVLTGLLTTL